MAELDRRDALMAAMEAAEEGTLDVPEERTPEAQESETQAMDQELDAEKFHETEAIAEHSEESAKISAQSESENTDEEEVEKSINRPSTWKKEYVQLWDKMEKGEQVTKQDFAKFAEYANQRETEYKKGVSAYKNEAEQAKNLMGAITPYAPMLQQRGIDPANYVASLAKADQILSNAPYDQKVELFHKLAQGYGIQLNGNQAQPVDAYQQQLMQQLARTNQEVNSIKSRYEQEEQSRLNVEIQKFSSDVEKYPHFELVREEMAQLLEVGKAHDLKTAYEQAVWVVPEVRELEVQRLVKKTSPQVSNAQKIAKAKAAAVSPKSVTPNGSVGVSDKKDRRSILADQLGQAMGSRL
jgi:hypothetical protein